MAKHVEDSTIRSAEALFPPSWIDRLIRWVDRLPGPAWLFYLSGVLATALLINAILWIDGSLPYGSAGSIDAISPPLVFYPLALYHYLTRVGSRSLQTYRSLLAVEDASSAQIDHELAALPRQLGWLAILLGLGFAAQYILGFPATFGSHAPRTALPFVAAIAATWFANATLFCLIVRSIRQLKMVRKLHAQATNINLLKLEPAHAFSRLTARTGIGVVLLLILAAYSNPVLFDITLAIVNFSVMALLAVIIFVLPLVGMRDLLEAEKKRVVNETSDLLQTASDSLGARSEAGTFPTCKA